MTCISNWFGSLLTASELSKLYTKAPTLADIRAKTSFEALKPAIRFLCTNMERMEYGAFIAYKRTLEAQAVIVGSSVKALNDYAEEMQVFGYETKEAK